MGSAEKTTGLRVCHVISSFRPRIGGAERVTEELCRRLQSLGMEIRVLTRRYPGTERRETFSGVIVERLGHPATGKLGALTFGLHALWRLTTGLRRFDVVHTSTHAALLVGLAARMLLSRTLVVTFHTDPRVVFGSARVTGGIRVRLLAHYGDTVVALNPFIRDALIDEGIPSDLIETLPNAVDTAEYRPPTPEERREARTALGLDEETVAYLFVGRLEQVKGVDIMLNAWSRLQEGGRCRLFIVGSGPERRTLESVASNLELEGVRFSGATSDVLTYLQAADVFVLPSRREGQSIALLEAMSAGLPVVASNVAGNRAVIEDGRTGLLFEVGDPRDLAEKLACLMSAQLREELGMAARDTALAEYSLKASVERHRDLYQNLRQVQ